MLKGTLIGLAALAVPSFGAIILSQTTVNELKIDGVSFGGGWAVSSPTLRSSRGNYLTYDASGRSPKVTLGRKGQKEPNTAWAFVEMNRFHDVLRNKGSRRDSDLERTGYHMKIQATEGPFKGWYLGQVDGDLVLVKNPRQAALLRLLVKEAEVTHK